MPWECSSCGFANNDDAAENCMCGFCNPTYPAPLTKTFENNSVVILNHKTSGYWFGLILIITIELYALFGAVIPVIWSGDINAVLPTDTRTSRNTSIFLLSIGMLAGIPALFRGTSSMGELQFHKDRLEIHALLFGRIKIYMYKDIIVNKHGSYRVTIRQRNLPKWKQPFKRLKALYIDGAGFGLSTSGYKDPSNLPLALSILKESTEFKEKALS